MKSCINISLDIDNLLKFFDIYSQIWVKYFTKIFQIYTMNTFKNIIQNMYSNTLW